MEKLSNTCFAALIAAMAVMLVFGVRGLGVAADGDDDILMYPNAPGAPGPVLFSHRVHGAGKAGYLCSKCHPDRSAEGPALTMERIRQGQACGACHDGRTAGPAGGRAAASIRDCSTCHMPAADIVFHLNRMDPVSFSHIRHLTLDADRKVFKTLGFSCGDCHPVPFARATGYPLGMEVPHETGACAQCHNGLERRDGKPSAFAANTRCLTCHKPPAPASKITDKGGSAEPC